MGRCGRFILLLILLLPCLAVAEFKPPAKPDHYVSDYAKIISVQEQEALSSDLKKYYQQSGNQIMIAIFKSLDGDEIQNASMKLAETWKVGKKGLNTGVIISVFNQEHEVRIEVGYGLEGKLTDAQSSIIIQTILIPEFRKGHYAQGLTAATTKIKSLISGEKQDRPLLKKQDDSKGVLLFGIAVLAYSLLCFKFASKTYMTMGVYLFIASILYYFFMGFPLPLLGLAVVMITVLMGQSWALVGSLSLFYICFIAEITRLLTSSISFRGGRGGGDDSSGGDDNSGGGGSFGGGGASGKW